MAGTGGDFRTATALVPAGCFAAAALPLAAPGAGIVGLAGADGADFRAACLIEVFTVTATFTGDSIGAAAFEFAATSGSVARDFDGD